MNGYFCSTVISVLAQKVPGVELLAVSMTHYAVFLENPLSYLWGNLSFSKGYAGAVVFSTTVGSWKKLVCGSRSFTYVQLHLQQNAAFENA